MNTIDQYMRPILIQEIAPSLKEARDRAAEKEYNEKVRTIRHKVHLRDSIYLKTVKTKIKNYNILTWNANAALNINSNKKELLRTYIEGINPHIFLGSEVLGMRGGYLPKKKEKYGKIDNMNLLSYDDYGVTAVYVRSDIKDIIPIFIDSEKLFPKTEPKYRIHASAAIQYLSKPIRNSSIIIFLALYRSPNIILSLLHLATILKFVINFSGEKKPNIILGGDLNIRSERLGSIDRETLLPSDRLQRKYRDGDKLFEILGKYGLSCINKYGQVTYCKQTKELCTEHIIDIMATNMTEAAGVKIDNNYLKDVKYTRESDHYPNLATLTKISIETQVPKVRSVWNMNNINSNQRKGYEEAMEKSAEELRGYVIENAFMINSDFEIAYLFIETIMSTLQQSQISAALQWFGKVTQRSDYKTYIDKETRKKMKEMRAFFKLHRTVIKTCQAWKRLWDKLLNYNPAKQIKTMRQSYRRTWIIYAQRVRMIKRLGKDLVKYHTEWKKKRWHIKKHVKYAKIIAKNEESERTIENYRSKAWYELAARIGTDNPNAPAYIPKLLKAKYATKEMPESIRHNLTARHFPKNNKANADNIVRYFCSIGHPSNEAYDHSINKSRARARVFDKEYDFIPKILAESDPYSLSLEQQRIVIKYRQDMNELNKPFTYAEIESVINDMANKKAYHGDIHILFVKWAKMHIIPFLVIVFEWWKDNGVCTNDMNDRIMNPLIKAKKDKQILACIRPIEYGKIEFKIYSTCLTRRYERYVWAYRLLPTAQFAAKKASGSEDCLIDITTDINVQHCNGIPVFMCANDCSDAYNSMDPEIIEDKMINYCGLDDRSMVMFRSLTHGVTSVCRVNGEFSDKVRPCNSKFSQGFAPSALIFCIYTAPLVRHINKNFKIRQRLCNRSTIYINAKITAKMLMDDITEYTRIWFEYTSDFRNEIKDLYHKSMEKTKNLSIKNFVKYQTNNIYVEIGQKVTKLMQEAITYTHTYFNTNNIPMNKTKTYVMAIEDAYTQRLQVFRAEFDKYARIILWINKELLKRNNNWDTFESHLFRRKIRELDRNKYDAKFIDEIIKYAVRERLWTKTKDKELRLYFIGLIESDKMERTTQDLQRISDKLCDHMRPFRKHQFQIDGIPIENSPEITVLGNIFDDKWTFNPQIRKVCGVMGQIRRKCHALLNKTNTPIGIGMIKYFIEATAMVQLDYNSCTYANLANTNPLRTCYNSLIKVMTHKLFTFSIQEHTNFNGFPSFESKMKRTNAKSFTRTLRHNDYNGLYVKKNRKIEEIRRWKQKERMWNNYDFNDHRRKFPKEREYDLQWIWYLDSVELQTSDIYTYEMKHFVRRNPVSYESYQIPDCIHFKPYTIAWTDLMINFNRITIVVDGSVTYFGRDRRGQMFGKGGCAIAIWFRGELIYQRTIPLSTRTQVNVTELYALTDALNWIAEDINLKTYVIKSEGIDIISDSQNCLSLISNKTIASDDVSINLYRKIGATMAVISRLNLRPGFIVFFWVPSHVEQSEMNDYVDLLAKSTTKYFLDLVENNKGLRREMYEQKIHTTEYHNLAVISEPNHIIEFDVNDKGHNQWLNPNSMISLNTVKSEIKYRAQKYDELSWNMYRKNLAINQQKIKYSSHYYALNIKWSPKKHAQVIPFMRTQLENDIRLMLLTAQLPLNAYLAYKACNLGQIAHCTQHHTCDQMYTEENLSHMLLVCPADVYKQPRQEMIDGIIGVYTDHNTRAETNKKIENYDFTQNIDEKEFLKQMIDPPSHLSPSDRAQIYIYIINYIKETRFDVVRRYLDGKCIKGSNRPEVFDRVEQMELDNGSDRE